jgi:uncharacterized protein involved in exopolysaccharide biosynthesis
MNEIKQPAAPDHPRQNLYSDEDEINLLDLLLVLVKRKWLIIAMVFIAGAAAVIISLQLPNIYRSEATIAAREQEQSSARALTGALGGLGGIAATEFGLGGGTEADKIEVLLKSRQLAQLVVEKYNLLPLLFEKKWDPRKKAWKENPAPTMQDAYKVITGMMKVTRDRKTNMITLSIEHKDPEFARSMAEYYITELSEDLRTEVLKDAQENMKFLNEQLERTTDPLLREKIYNMLAKEIEKHTFAKAQKYYGFYVLDPPIAPDLNKKAKPKRSMICILSVVVAFFVAVFLAFFLEYMNRVKKEDTERYAQLRQGLKFWRRK